MKRVSLNCPSCGQAFEAAPGSASQYCPSCNAEVKGEQADPSLAEEALNLFVNRGGGLLLIGGLATLGFCWYYGNGSGLVGGGFLAVVGAILLQKK